MHFFTELTSRIGALAALLPGDVSVQTLGSSVNELSDESVCQLAEATVQARRMLEQLALATSAVIGARSARDRGHSGLAQAQGHRSPAALIQQISGVNRAEAIRQVRVGTALIEAEQLGTGQLGVGLSSPTDSDLPLDSASALDAPRCASWHAPLDAAMRNGTLSSEQYDAIRRGLGEPSAAPGLDADVKAEVDADTDADTDVEARGAWSLAASDLLRCAAEVSVEELAKQARAVRDLLDPEGARPRFDAKYEARSFRMWTDRDGFAHGKFVFDPESAEWVRNIIDTALSPRRGGPRFVSAAEQARAKRLHDDPRSNEQLAHDLLLDVLKAGAVADAESVFGARQAGLKLVQVVSRDVHLRGGSGGDTIAHVTRLHESGDILPTGVAAKHRCNTGTQALTVDEHGDPLNVGREQRLFTSKQRIALAVRDGGCRWIGCDRSASFCEAHHIDEWKADQGRTDIDRGVLLCRFHHLQLHNNGWKISRRERGSFMLHSPPGSARAPSTIESVELPPPLSVTYAWQLAQAPLAQTPLAQTPPDQALPDRTRRAA